MASSVLIGWINLVLKFPYNKSEEQKKFVLRTYFTLWVIWMNNLMSSSIEDITLICQLIFGIYHPQKCVARNWIKCADLHSKIIFAIPPILIFLVIEQNIKICTEKLILTNSHPSWVLGGVQLTEIIFTKNCMKYPDLHTKVMLTNDYSSSDGEG